LRVRAISVAQKRSHLPTLDGLRGLAILSVLCWHYSRLLEPAKNPITYYVTTVFNLSWSGVDLFFVLSGFLIGGILIDNRDAKNLWSVFYLRRSLRIFPLYFFILILFIFFLQDVPWPLDAPQPDNPIPLWSYATFTQNFLIGLKGTFGPNWLGATWSLAIEEQFYILLPLLIVSLKPRLFPWFVLGAIAVATPLRIIFYHADNAFLSFFVLMPCRMDSLLMGVACAIAYRSSDAMNFIKANRPLANIVIAILFYAVIVLAFFNSHPYSPGMAYGGYALLAALYSAILLVSIDDKGLLQKITTWAPFRKLGEIAFGVYLTHQIALGLAFIVLRGKNPEIKTSADVLTVLAALAATIAFSKASWELVERRLTSIGRSTAFERSEPSAGATEKMAGSTRSQ
jgi:peptidoglycan/LPS O-acetylase OafA/YrhL